jgi:hypothetical protein
MGRPRWKTKTLHRTAYGMSVQRALPMRVNIEADLNNCTNADKSKDHNSNVQKRVLPKLTLSHTMHYRLGHGTNISVTP